MALFITIPASLAIILASRQFSSSTAWGTWLTTLLVGSVAVFLLWRPLISLYQRNLGQWLSYLALLMLPGCIVVAIIEIALYSTTGGNLMMAIGSLLAWLVLGTLGGFILGRPLMWVYGPPE